MGFKSIRGAGWAFAFAAALVVCQSRSIAAPAAALGPQAAIGEPANGYVGRLAALPSHGPAGTPVTLSAEGLPPREEFELVWSTAIGEWQVADAEYHGREFTPVAYEIARAVTDGAGRLAAHFVAPEDYGFQHDIVLQQGGRLFTQVAFNLDMTVEISPKSGPPGTPITISANGWCRRWAPRPSAPTSPTTSSAPRWGVR